MKAHPKLRSLGFIFLVCLASAAIVWLTVSKNPLAHPARQSGVEKTDGETVAIVGDTRVTVSEIEKQVKAELYNLKRKAVNETIARVLMEQEAKRRGTSVADLTRLEVEGKAEQATLEERKEEYERAKVRFADKTEAELLSKVDESLRRRKVNERGQEFINELRSKTEVKVLLEPPRFDVDASDDPSLGPENAPVTIVEFSEFQCPYCAQVQPTLKQVKEHFGDKIRLVFRDYPLPMHKDAPKAAEAATCANEQGKFWELHDKLFANAARLQVSDLKRYAAEIGLQMDRFNQCLDSGKYTTEWQADKRDGTAYGINGTPAFFINGRMVGGAVPYKDLVQVIEEELRRAESEPKIARK